MIVSVCVLAAKIRTHERSNELLDATSIINSDVLSPIVFSIVIHEGMDEMIFHRLLLSIGTVTFSWVLLTLISFCGMFM